MLQFFDAQTIAIRVKDTSLCASRVFSVRLMIEEVGPTCFAFLSWSYN